MALKLLAGDRCRPTRSAPTAAVIPVGSSSRNQAGWQRRGNDRCGGAALGQELVAEVVVRGYGSKRLRSRPARRRVGRPRRTPGRWWRSRRPEGPKARGSMKSRRPSAVNTRPVGATAAARPRGGVRDPPGVHQLKDGPAAPLVDRVRGPGSCFWVSDAGCSVSMTDPPRAGSPRSRSARRRGAGRSRYRGAVGHSVVGGAVPARWAYDEPVALLATGKVVRARTGPWSWQRCFFVRL